MANLPDPDDLAKYDLYFEQYKPVRDLVPGEIISYNHMCYVVLSVVTVRAENTTYVTCVNHGDLHALIHGPDSPPDPHLVVPQTVLSVHLIRAIVDCERVPTYGQCEEFYKQVLDDDVTIEWGGGHPALLPVYQASRLKKPEAT